MRWCLLFLMCVFSLPQLFADNEEGAQCVLTWIRGGQTDSLKARMHPAIRSEFTAAELAMIWPQLEKQSGTYRSQENWKTERLDTLDIEQCILNFEEEQVRFVLLTDTSRLIVGFHFTPVTSTEKPRIRPRMKEGYVECDTFLLNGRIKLPAVVCVPARTGQKFPMVVMVHGLGPVDKDGTIGPNKPYREIAHALASAGIATFRYDKRSYVYGSCPNKFGQPATYDTEVVDDALTALDQVLEFPDVDPSRIYLMGHSLGAMLAPRIAMLSDVRLAGLIAASATARHLEDWLSSQFRYIAQIQGNTVEQADSLTRMIYSKMPSSYRSFAQEYNQVGTARGLHIPMLFLQGGYDFQLTDEDFQLWQRGLEGCDDVRYIWLDDCDHLLRQETEVGEPAFYMRPGHVAQKALDEMIRFIQQR